MSNDTASSEQRSAPRLHLEGPVSATASIHFTTTSLEELAKVMAYFNLGVKIETKVADKKDDKKKDDKKGNETPAATAPAAGGTSSPAPAPAASAPPASGGDAVEPAKAAEAVRAYGAKFGIDKARELLKKHGFEKTAEITADKAAAVHAEATAATAAQDL
jgi:hypothetical protein